MQVEHAILLKKYWTDFRFKALLSTYGMMMLTSMAVASNSESSEEQICHNRLLINMTVQYVQQIRQRLEWNPENETAKATQRKLPTSAYPAPRAIEGAAQLAPTHASIQFLLLFFMYTSSWPACNFSIVVSQYSLNTVLVDQP